MFKMLKNQKGMTLVELLAVMVIVGIIAAISIPAIGNLLENTRKDAVLSDAQAIQEAARLFVTGEDITYKTSSADNITVVTEGNGTDNAVFKVSQTDLSNTGYLDTIMIDPKKQNYNTAEVTITITKDGTVTYQTQLSSPSYNFTGDAKTSTRNNIS